MFDPTAFENMKVVLEGALYDQDLSGEIQIVDRNDLINTAKLSREFDVSFQLNLQAPYVICKVRLLANIENLIAEIIPMNPQNISAAGCFVIIQFFFKHNHEEVFINRVIKKIGQIWGTTRNIKMNVTHDPFQVDNVMQYSVEIAFDRIITENQIDDLIEMSNFMQQTLHGLEKIFNQED